ncbi:MAG: hypothetical protein PQ612_10120 [Rickettsiales bacterium]|nr:hypothetical protein [Pseudomonadota bacterium]MDA0967592.1 hypothetical protein [Pseudomonadota bacterium]MDG4544379.1 hypothetical protein [Rickettsiales bacterium]MDG4546509.1 hypothetical protein [Rickettsiales bacterium]MDG4548655.1 hypothetical protein [Rickettsiales bacterium]
MTQPSEQDVNSQEDRAVRIMRSVVINMGILLVIGTIALFVAVIMKSNSSSDKKAESKATTQDEIFKQGECMAYKQVDVPLMGKVISSDTHNNILTITTTDQVIAYNLCTGKVIAKFQSVGNN